MSIRILIVDDHLLFREGVRALLCKEPDLEIAAEASDGITAVRLATELRPDVILMDITMPVMNGIDATRQIVEETTDVRVLVISMESDRSFVIEALNAGAIGYLLKDCAYTELISAIHCVAAGEPYLSPMIANLVIKEYMQRGHADNSKTTGKLTERENTVLQMIANGKNTKDIAAAFNVSLKTIDSHRHSIMNKLNLYSTAELTKYAVRTGISSL